MGTPPASELTDLMIAIPRKMTFNVWLVAMFLGLVAGVTGLLLPVEQLFYSMRSQVAQKEASGEIVIVGIDENALDKYDGWPWSRERLAQVLGDIDALGPKRILYDISFARKMPDGVDDPLEVAARNSHEEVYFGLLRQYREPDQHFVTEDYVDHHLTGQEGRQVYLGADLNPYGAVYALPYGADLIENSDDRKAHSENGVREALIPHISVVAAGSEAFARKRIAAGDRYYHVDNSIAPESIPQISLADLPANASMIRGKTVVIAPTARTLRDIVVMPFESETPGIIASIMGAETLLSGQPADLGFWPALAGIGVVLALALIVAPSSWASVLILLFIQVALFVVAGVMERDLLFMQIMPASVAATAFTVLLWRTRVRLAAREAARRDQQTGLPNLAAHVARIAALTPEENQSRVIVAASITNAEDVVAILNEENLTIFYNEIARRVAATDEDLAVHRAAVDTITWDITTDSCADPEIYARSLRAMMLVPFQIGNQRIRAEIAIGFCLATEGAATRRLSNAMHASHRAASQNHLFEVNSGRSAAEADWRLAITGDANALIDKGEMHLAYQPKLDLRTEKWVAAEALMRWTHEGFGNVPPSDFIPLAETSSAIHDLTYFSLRESLDALCKFREIDPNFDVSVNLSPVLLDDSRLVDTFLAIFEEKGFDPSAAMFEITEAARITNVARGIGILETMVEKGMRLSIDDYGTGHSTLDYLRIIPAHEVKLDRSFVDNLLINMQDRDLVGSTIELAHKLGLKVVAEGVENRETINVLARLGCDIVQGYAIGRPMAGEEFLANMKSENESKVAQQG